MLFRTISNFAYAKSTIDIDLKVGCSQIWCSQSVGLEVVALATGSSPTTNTTQKQYGHHFKIPWDPTDR